MVIADKVRSKHDLYRWSRTRQSVDPGHVQEHLRYSQVPHRGLHCSRLCRWVDDRLYIVPPLHMLSDHCIHRAILWE